MKEFEVIRDGVTPNRALYQCLMASVRCFPGAFAEFGVHKGATFEVIMHEAEKQSRRVHAFDSFTGMAAPRMPGDDLYPEGAFDVGGPDAFQQAFPGAIVHAGYVADTLRYLEDADVRLAFAHIDLDHYEPTLQALEAVWPCISPGGIMACHDFRFGQTCRAAGAISDWIARNGPAGSMIYYYPEDALPADIEQIESILRESLKHKHATYVAGKGAKVDFPHVELQHEGLSDMTIWFRKGVS